MFAYIYDYVTETLVKTFGVLEENVKKEQDDIITKCEKRELCRVYAPDIDDNIEDDGHRISNYF